MTEDLGPQPDPQIEPGEPNPGGVDAVSHGDGVDGEATEGDPVARDLDPDDNPAVEDVLPDEMRQGEDTSTEATRGDGSDDGDGEPTEESPA
ncbi:hypothetical protein FE634_16030 [Nocardioides dongxiaopingii]|uniref:hypothetical protein n=1 Tax=Nocardioides TaxID=1839 RepID=UPI0010C769BF|nr:MULTISPECIES: hypothetical protein [Nocardioides]QCW51545.1 hypothetical protein FE634_16030 [Nocardioides sp. S-1144]